MKFKQLSLPLARIKVSAAALLVTVGLVATSAAPTLADPSAATQKFFGFSSSGGSSSTAQPASCDISKIKAENQVLLKQEADLNDQSAAQLKELQSEMSKIKQGDTAAFQQNQAAQDELLKSTQQKLKDLQAQQDKLKEATQGPSDQCKKDLVAQSVADMQRTLSAVSGGQISATLAKVDSVTAEIENLVPSLGKAGVNGRDIATINKELATVKAANATLKSFFSSMQSQGAAFISAANADPVGMYDKLSSGQSPLSSGLTNGASAAADNLVSSFTSLVNLFDKLTGQGGQ